jgi:hypothetical protein
MLAGPHALDEATYLLGLQRSGSPLLKISPLTNRPRRTTLSVILERGLGVDRDLGSCRFYEAGSSSPVLELPEKPLSSTKSKIA